MDRSSTTSNQIAAILATDIDALRSRVAAATSHALPSVRPHLSTLLAVLGPGEEDVKPTIEDEDVKPVLAHGGERMLPDDGVGHASAREARPMKRVKIESEAL